jgi:hypothetical protein
MQNALSTIFGHLQMKDTASSFDEKFRHLAEYLDHLVSHDFNKLISILYRIDVSEEKAKQALANKKEDETNGDILAKLLLEREHEKIKFRERYRTKL